MTYQQDEHVIKIVISYLTQFVGLVEHFECCPPMDIAV